MELQPEMSSCTDVDNHEVTRRLRVVLILSVPALQLVAIYVTHELYAWIPHLKYVDMETSWDRHIPYMAWSCCLVCSGTLAFAQVGSPAHGRHLLRPDRNRGVAPSGHSHASSLAASARPGASATEFQNRLRHPAAGLFPVNARCPRCHPRLHRLLCLQI